METSKKELRNRMKKIRDDISGEEKLRLSERMAESLFIMPEYKVAENILTYVSFGSEINTNPIIKDALQRGKYVGVPRIDQKTMNFYQIQDLEELSHGFYGILEPDDTHIEMFEPKSALVIVPGLVFDRNMNRIGYGGGYYDRFLSRPFAQNYLKIAFAFEFQVMDELPFVDPYDVPLDKIITESHVYDLNI